MALSSLSRMELGYFKSINLNLLENNEAQKVKTGKLFELIFPVI